MPEVLAIEAASFGSPWAEEDFLRCLRAKSRIGMVAEANFGGPGGEKVVGFMIYELHKKRLEILNFAACPQHRRLGVGRQMAAKLVGKLASHRRTKLGLVVSDHNLGAHLFWRAMGFRATAVLRGHYEDTGQDGYRLEYRLRPG